MARRPVKWTLTREPDLTGAAADPRDDIPTNSTRSATTPSGDDRGEARVAGETAALDTPPARCVDRSADGARRRFRVSLHVRGRRRRRLAPAHREPRERRRPSGALVRRHPAAVVLRRHQRPARASTSSPSIPAASRSPAYRSRVSLDSRCSGTRSAAPKAAASTRGTPNGLEIPAGRMDGDQHAPHRVAVKMPVPEGGFYTVRAIGARRRRPPDANRRRPSTRSVPATRRGSASITTASRSSPRRRRGSRARPRAS